MSFFNKLPALPKGLEYEHVNDEPLMCHECMGYVISPNVLIKKTSTRKNLTWKNYFPASEGICIECSKEKFGEFLNQHYEAANNFLEISENVEDKDKKDVYGGIVDVYANFVDVISEFLTEMENIETNYLEGTKINLDEEDKEKNDGNNKKNE